MSHISYFILRVLFFVREGIMEVSDAAVDTVALQVDEKNGL